MVMKELAGRLRETNDPKDLVFAKQVELRLKKRGSDFPLSAESSKIYPEISLMEEIERQANKYLELEFHKHKEVRMSKGRFKDLVMKLVVPQPESFKSRLDTPVIVFGQIPAEDQCRLAGIDYALRRLNEKDWPNDPMGYRTPKIPYITWTDEGKRFMPREVNLLRSELLLDERGGTEFDGVGLYIAKPQILRARFLDLPGTSVGSGDSAYLYLWRDRPRLVCVTVGNVGPVFGSLVCGR